MPDVKDDARQLHRIGDCPGHVIEIKSGDNLYELINKSGINFSSVILRSAIFQSVNVV